MSKSSLIQQTNRYDELAALLEEFSILFTRALDFLDHVSSLLRKSGIKCTYIDYKTANKQIYEVGQGKFNISLSCEVKGSKGFSLHFECNFISGTVRWFKDNTSELKFIPKEAASTISLHFLSDLRL